jgi:hypothetical protein
MTIYLVYEPKYKIINFLENRFDLKVYLNVYMQSFF